MARRRTAAEQIGVPELDEQEEREQQELQARLEAEQDEAKRAAEAAKPPEPPAPEVPEWVPEKFRKDPAKFAEAHRHLEDQLRQRAENERQLEQRLAELEEQAQRTSSDGDTMFGIPRDRIEAAYEENPLETMLWLAEQTNAVSTQRAVGERARADEPGDHLQNELFAKTVDDMMAAEYEDWNDVKPLVGERLAEDPTLMPETAFGSLNQVKRHMSMIYKDIKFDELRNEQQDLRNRGLQQKDLDRARKQEAQTLTGATGRAPEPTEAEKELAEMRAALAGTSYSLHRAQEKRG